VVGLWAEFINFWILHELGTGEARDFKFGTRIDVYMSHLTDNKIPPSEVWWRFRGQICKFWTLFINLERVYLETSNLVRR